MPDAVISTLCYQSGVVNKMQVMSESNTVVAENIMLRTSKYKLFFHNLVHRWQWKRDVPKLSFQTIQKRNRLKIRSYHRYGEHGKKKAYFLPSERDREFLSPVFYTAAPKCVCIRCLAGACHLSPVVLWTLWPEGGSEPLTGAPFRINGAVVGFVDRCLSRTRNLAASNKHLVEFFSGRSWPKIGPGIIFFGVFENRPRNYFFRGFWKVWNFFFEDLRS